MFLNFQRIIIFVDKLNALLAMIYEINNWKNCTVEIYELNFIVKILYTSI